MARYDDTFVDRFLEPWNRHDVDGALALITDDCVWEVTRGREPRCTLYTGQTAVRSTIAGPFEVLPDIHYQPIRSLPEAALSALAVHPGARGRNLSGYGDGLRGVVSTWRNPVPPYAP